MQTIRRVFIHEAKTLLHWVACFNWLKTDLWYFSVLFVLQRDTSTTHEHLQSLGQQKQQLFRRSSPCESENVQTLLRRKLRGRYRPQTEDRPLFGVHGRFDKCVWFPWNVSFAQIKNIWDTKTDQSHEPWCCVLGASRDMPANWKEKVVTV